MNTLVCAITGKRSDDMRVKVFLRLLNAVIIVFIKMHAGIDWVVAYGLIIVITDLDSIAENIEKKWGGKCDEK